MRAASAGSPVQRQSTDMAELLLELLSEEIPARMQRHAIEDLTGLLSEKLAAAEIPARGIRGYVTPRRLVVVAKGIPATQSDRTEERRGTPRGGPPPGHRSRRSTAFFAPRGSLLLRNARFATPVEVNSILP